MTQAYWGGHFGEVMSGVGNVGSTVSANISDRAGLGNPEHQWVVRARMLTTVLVFVIAGVGLLRRRRGGIEDRVLLVLIAAPIGLAFMQSYGGEMALRVYLFALAPASVLVALALFPRPVSRPSFLARSAAGVLGLVMLFSFFITRYGNEPFERIDSGAVSAVGSVYDQTTDDVRFLYVTAVPELNSTPFMPLGYRDVERVHWSNTMAPLDPTDVAGVLQALREKGPDTYLITTRSQERSSSSVRDTPWVGARSSATRWPTRPGSERSSRTRTPPSTRSTGLRSRSRPQGADVHRSAGVAHSVDRCRCGLPGPACGHPGRA